MVTDALLLLPVQLTNKADPTKRNGADGTDKQIDLMSSSTGTDINAVAWIAASDTTQAQVVTGVYPPRMPELVASSGSIPGLTYCWKLKVVNHGLHGPNGNPYRDFDSGASLTSAQIIELTNTTSATAYTDDIDIPLPSGSADSNAVNGWVQITDGSPWNIYQDNDWINQQLQGFFGGDAELSLKILDSSGNTICPEQDYYFRIAGENPDPTVCQTYINTTYNGPTPNWTGLTFTSGTVPPTVPGYWFAYAISKEETDGNGGRTYYSQFLDDGGTHNSAASSHGVPGKEGYPNWQNDSSDSGSGGYGLFQLTYEASEADFIMPRDWIWNWVTNVQQFLPIIKQKLQDAQYSVNHTKTKYPSSFTDPSSLTTTADTTTFKFWESTVITRYNGGRGWNLSPGSGWHYTPNPQNYLYEVARKGVENHP